MSTDSLGEITLNHSRKIFDLARKEPLESAFGQLFSSELDKLALLNLQNQQLPPTETKELVKEEGMAGVIPAGARAAMLRSTLSGAVLPLRVSYTEKQTTLPDSQSIDRAQMYLLIEVGAADMMNSKRIKAVIAAIRSAGLKSNSKDVMLPNPVSSEPQSDIQVKQFGATIKFFQRNGLGEYRSYNVGINNSADTEHAIDTYQKALSGTLEFGANPDTQDDSSHSEERTIMDYLLKDANFPPNPQNDQNAYELMNRGLLEEIQSVPKALILPIVLEPTEFIRMWGAYRFEAVYHSRPMYSTVGDAPFMMIPNSGLPYVAQYDTKERAVKEV